MTLFLWNIFLTLAWAALTGSFSLLNLGAGFLLSYGILLFAQQAVGSSSYFTKVRMGINFVLFFIKELLLANLRVAFDVITPSHRMKPCIIAVPLDAETDAEIMLLANLVALTPGTLVLDISDDRKVLFVHALYAPDPDALRREIKDGFERRVLEMLR